MLYDNGLDRLNPLKDNIYYSTITDKITDKEGVEIIIHEEDNDIFALSAEESASRSPNISFTKRFR